MQIVKYLVLFFWVEAIMLFSLGCTGARERRGDWMEHLNHRQFSYEAPMSHWDRHNYYSLEELTLMWNETYAKAMADLDKVIEENTD